MSCSSFELGRGLTVSPSDSGDWLRCLAPEPAVCTYVSMLSPQGVRRGRLSWSCNLVACPTDAGMRERGCRDWEMKAFLTEAERFQSRHDDRVDIGCGDDTLRTPPPPPCER